MMRIVCMISAGILSASCATTQPTLTPVQKADAAAIENLRVAGSDMSKPHSTDFYLHFPHQDSARNAANELKASGFELRKILPGEKAASWTVIVSKSIVPTFAEMSKIDRKLNKLARKYGGDYDGWEAIVTK